MSSSSMEFVVPWPLLVSLLWTAGCAGNRAAQMEEQIEIARREGNPVVLVERAELLAGLGDFTRAEQYLNAALENGGDTRDILPRLVSICVKDQRYRSAAQYLENHLRVHPRDHRMRFVLATLYAGLELSEAARDELERVLASVPSHAVAHFTLARLYRDGFGDYGKADRHFRRYLALQPHGSHAEEARESLLVRVP